MRKLVGSLALLAGLATLANADLLEFGVGAGVWNAKPSGEAEYKKSGVGDRFDIKDDTGLSSATKPYVWAFLKHPIPLVPNVKLEHSSFASDATKDTNIEFGGHTFSTSTKTELSLSQLDAILYYTLPIPLVDIDLGIGAKAVSGDISMSSAGVSEKADLGVVLPIAYGAVRFDIPATSAGVEADIKYIGYDKSHFSDLRFKADYKIIDSVIKLGIEAGYRAQNIVIKDISGVDAEVDIKIAGIFGGVFARF